MKRLTIAALATCLMAQGAAAEGRAAGDWLFRVGGGVVDPKSGNLDTVLAGGPATINVDSGVSVTFNGTYMVTDHFGIELLASLPFEHDIELAGVGEIGSTKHLPPTLSAQWHFSPIGRLVPYVGVGLNWTLFFDEEANATLNSLGGSDVKLDDSVGIALQAGVDLLAGENWFVNFDVRWINIETDATVTVQPGSALNPGATAIEADIGTVEIDPVVYGLHVGWRF